MATKARALRLSIMRKTHAADLVQKSEIIEYLKQIDETNPYRRALSPRWYEDALRRIIVTTIFLSKDNRYLRRKYGLDDPNEFYGDLEHKLKDVHLPAGYGDVKLRHESLPGRPVKSGGGREAGLRPVGKGKAKAGKP